MSMSDAEIREALARAERATSGPWVRWDGHTRVVAGTPTTNTPGHISGFQRVVADTEDDESDGVIDVINAEFIAHARTDVPRLAADLLAARAERDEARAALSTPTLAKRQPCGCVVCTCGDVERCGGCGARMCDRHRDDRPSLANDPATVWEAHPLLARAETAEARCRELEAERAIVADYLRDTDADFRARRPSDRAVLDALLSPPPPHTCQIHRATSGASDCGLSPCEEAKVHTDRGASRPATVRRVRPAPSQEARCGSRTKLRGSDGRPLCERHGGVRADFQQNDEPCMRVQTTPVEDMPRAQVQAELAARGIDVAPAVAKVMDALGRTRECACPDPRCAQHGSAPAPCSSCVGDGTVGDIVATIAATVPGKHVSSLHGSQEITALRAEVDRLHTQRGDDAQQLIDFAATLAIAEEDVAWDALRARVAALEAVERAARSEIAYMDETKAAHPDALVEPTLSELRAALARLDRP